MPAWWSALKLLLGVAAVAAVLAALVPASGPAKALLAAKRQLDPDDPVAYCDEVLAQAAQQQANPDLDKILGSEREKEKKISKPKKLFGERTRRSFRGTTPRLLGSINTDSSNEFK